MCRCGGQGSSSSASICRPAPGRGQPAYGAYVAAALPLLLPPLGSARGPGGPPARRPPRRAAAAAAARPRPMGPVRASAYFVYAAQKDAIARVVPDWLVGVCVCMYVCMYVWVTGRMSAEVPRRDRSAICLPPLPCPFRRPKIGPMRGQPAKFRAFAAGLQAPSRCENKAAAVAGCPAAYTRAGGPAGRGARRPIYDASSSVAPCL